jgi:chemotaxis methyl-accepting protein methylase
MPGAPEPADVVPAVTAVPGAASYPGPVTPRLAPVFLDPLSDSDDPEGFAALLAQVEREHGFRARSYKERCLRRRVAVRMRATGTHAFGDYARRLSADPCEYERLLDALTINVTKLFRNADAWQALAEHALPSLWPLVGGGSVRAWSAGCATGEEAYSIAALLHAGGRRAGEPGAPAHEGPAQVLGTDVDRASLAAAEAACYAEGAFADAPEALRARYFAPAAGGAAPTWRAAPELRALVGFSAHDLLRDAPPDGPWHLIVCRNVVIYFDRASQEALFERFHAALAPGGVLFLGKVETLLGRMRTLFAPVDARQRIFRRV